MKMGSKLHARRYTDGEVSAEDAYTDGCMHCLSTEDQLNGEAHTTFLLERGENWEKKRISRISV
jgi:hypothetical protein